MISFVLDNSNVIDKPTTWINELIELATSNDIYNKFAVLHLNVNSVREKMSNIDRILALEMFDIVMLNESKLDDSVPLCFYINENYRIIRRDRGKAGGGLLLFVKKKYSISFIHSSLEHEFIYFELKIKSALFAFVSAYKSPSLLDSDFLDELQDYLFTRNMNLPLFVVRDLNMDLSSQKGSKLVEFMHFSR
jgi:exonuclease III